MRICSLFLLVLLLEGTVACNRIKTKLPCVNVTVWVHGTHPAKKLLESKFSPMRSQVYVPAGLSLACEQPSHYNFATIAQECHKRNPEEYNLDNFYTFGWNSAKINPAQRQKAGKQLYHELENLIKIYKQKYSVIKLKIIGFSHGGNVILNCLSHLPFSYKDVLTDVVLIATPIQESTRWYANTPYVNKVYSLYSDGDWIQRIDMQKFHRNAPKNTPVLSGRTFKEFDRVMQVNFRFNGKAIGHIKYRSVMKYIPDIVRQIDEQIASNPSRRHMGLNFVTTQGKGLL